MSEPRRHEGKGFQRHLYDVAFEMYRYIHADVWRGQQYYTTLNVAILGLGFGFLEAVLKLQPLPKDAFRLVIPIFAVGLLTSLLGFQTIRRLGRSFLEAIWFKTVAEASLQHELDAVRDEAQAYNRRFLTPIYHMKEEDRTQALQCPDLWIERNIWRPWGITCCFMILQLAFLFFNIIGIVAIVHYVL